MNASSVHVVNSTFSDNIIPDDSAAIIHSSGDVWLEGTALVNNSVILPLISDMSGTDEVSSDLPEFSSDVPRDVFIGLSYDLMDTSVRPDDVDSFLNGDEGWFQDIRAVWSRPGFPFGYTLLPASELPFTITCRRACTSMRRQRAVTCCLLQLMHVRAGIPQRQPQQRSCR